MLKTKVSLKSVSKIQYSKQYQVPKLENEDHGEYEERTWINRLHVNEKNEAIIPSIAFKKAIDIAAKHLGKIPGKGNETYTKYFLGGVVVMNDINTGVKKEDIEKNGQWLWCDAQGGGSGKRVLKCFPIVESWSGDLDILITTDNIDRKAFEKALNIAGVNVGILSYRPANGGNNGMFIVKNIEYTDIGDDTSELENI